MNLKEKTALHLQNIIQKNIGPITGKYVLIYDTESTLSKLLKDWYESILGEKLESKVFDPCDTEFKANLITLPRGSLIILVQSTNFRITDFRIRLELFQYWIHCVEHNHLGYYPDEQVETYINSLEYRTPEYIAATKLLTEITEYTEINTIYGSNGEVLKFWKLESIRGNTGDYSENETKGGTFPIGEAFTEAIDLKQVNGNCRVFGYPNDAFQVVFCDPFTVEILDGILLDNPKHPEDFRKLMDRIRSEEDGEAIIREFGIWFNPAISKQHQLSDVNWHERHLGVHLSIGKKHGIFSKKFPKWILQKFHIDLFLEVSHLQFWNTRVDFDQKQILVASSK
jgi:aminopeptidase